MIRRHDCGIMLDGIGMETILCQYISPKCPSGNEIVECNQKKLQTALCKNRGKLSGGGGEINKFASENVSAARNSFLLLLAV
jgi:hypothetical protein